MGTTRTASPPPTGARHLADRSRRHAGAARSHARRNHLPAARRELGRARGALSDAREATRKIKVPRSTPFADVPLVGGLIDGTVKQAVRTERADARRAVSGARRHVAGARRAVGRAEERALARRKPAQMPTSTFRDLVKGAKAAGVPTRWAASPATDFIVRHESTYSPKADNESSTAYGYFQLLTEKSPNGVVQAKNGFEYIKDRYGSPEQAKQFWDANGWY